jgi:hypothetical protein
MAARAAVLKEGPAGAAHPCLTTAVSYKYGCVLPYESDVA